MAPRGFEVKSWKRTGGAGGQGFGAHQEPVSAGPGESDLVERLRPELFRGACHHAAAEGAIELGGGIVVGKRPDHHALEAALQQVAARGSEQPAAEAEALKLRSQIELVDLAFEVQAAGAVAA